MNSSSAFILISLTICALCSSRVGATNDVQPAGEPEDDNTYGVIVDCGSSGTRAHIYEWDSGKGYPELLHDIVPMRDEHGKPVSRKITPGLSSMAETPDKASEYIDPLVKFILSKIPASRIRNTGIYVLATAGMRLLDEDTQLQIMTDIAKYLESYNFAKVKTSVISGADEGMFQWISVNAKAKRFLNANVERGSPTYAVVEMGGASIQITYQLRPGMEDMITNFLWGLNSAVEAFKSQIVEPSISREDPEHNFKLVSITFLGLGGNSAREAYVDLLIKSLTKRWYYTLSDRLFNTKFTSYDANGVLRLKDPCLPRGSNETMLKPVRMLHSKSQTVGFTIEDDEETFTVALTGSGNYKECRRRLEKMVDRAKYERMNCKQDEPCTMSLLRTNFVPYHRFEVLGLSDFFYTSKSMGDISGAYDRRRLISKAKKICGTPEPLLLRKFPDANNDDKTRVRLECFKAVWMEVFLSQAINLPDDFEDFKTVGQIRGDALEWTLGAVLDKSLAIEKASSEIEELGGSVGTQ